MDHRCKGHKIRKSERVLPRDHRPEGDSHSGNTLGSTMSDQLDELLLPFLPDFIVRLALGLRPRHVEPRHPSANDAHDYECDDGV